MRIEGGEAFRYYTLDRAMPVFRNIIKISQYRLCREAYLRDGVTLLLEAISKAAIPGYYIADYAKALEIVHIFGRTNLGLLTSARNRRLRLGWYTRRPDSDRIR